MRRNRIASSLATVTAFLLKTKMLVATGWLLALLPAIAPLCALAEDLPKFEGVPLGHKNEWVQIPVTTDGIRRAIGGVVVDRANGDVYFVCSYSGMGGQGVYKSTDRLAGFFGRIDGKAVTGAGFPMLADPKGGGRVAVIAMYATGGLTLDGGKTWPIRVGGSDMAFVDWDDPEPKTIIKMGHDGGKQLTVDGGKTWAKVVWPVERFDLDTCGFGAFGPNALIFVSPKGIQRSEDQGKTWKQVSSEAPSGLIMEKFKGVGYFLSEKGVLVSKDQGKTWEVQGNPPPVEQYPVLDPKKPAATPGGRKGPWFGPVWGKDENHFFVLGELNFNVYETTDGGKTWTTAMPLPKICEGVQYKNVRLAYDPTSDILYLAPPAWTFSEGHYVTPRHWNLFRYERDSKAAKSEPARSKWMVITQDLLADMEKNVRDPARYSRTSGLAVDRTTGDVFVMLANGQFYRTGDRGKTFERIDKKNPETCICRSGSGICLDPENGKHIALFTHGNTEPCGYTTDGGKTWSGLGKSARSGYKVYGSYPKEPPICFSWNYGAVDWGQGSKTIFGGARRSYYTKPASFLLSVDAGQTWKDVADSETEEVGAGLGLIDAQMLVISRGNGIERSTDGGATWAKVSDLKPKSHVAAVFKGAAYWVGAEGLIISRDKGQTWSVQGTAVDAVYGPLFGKDEKSIVVVGPKAIYETADAGKTWKEAAPLDIPLDPLGYYGREFHLDAWLDSFGWDPIGRVLYHCRLGEHVRKYEQ